MRHISIDLETLGLGETACILSIGAIEFDPMTGTFGESYSVVVDIEDEKGGGTIDAAAVAWWMRQSQEARDAIFGPDVDRVPLLYALAGLSEFLGFNDSLSEGEYPEVTLWQRGDRDWLWLCSAYKGMGLREPLKFWQVRDQRTFCDLFSAYLPVRTSNDKHNALADAIYQARCIHAVVSRLVGCIAIPPLPPADLWRRGDLGGSVQYPANLPPSAEGEKPEA